MDTYLSVLAGFAVYFISVFLRGVQQKSLIHHKVYGATLFSAAICGFDNIAIIVVASHSSYWLIPTNMLGAGLGMLSSILLYERIRNRGEGVGK